MGYLNIAKYHPLTFDKSEIKPSSKCHVDMMVNVEERYLRLFFPQDEEHL